MESSYIEKFGIHSLKLEYVAADNRSRCVASTVTSFASNIFPDEGISDAGKSISFD
jgi:hypothetical protein